MILCEKKSKKLRIAKAIPKIYKIMQIKPLHPSLIIFSSVSWILPRASCGIWQSLLRRPSLTSSLRDLPNMSDSQILSGSSSNSLRRYFISSSDWLSVPTTGATSVSISAFKRCIDGAEAESLTP